MPSALAIEEAARPPGRRIGRRADRTPAQLEQEAARGTPAAAAAEDQTERKHQSLAQYPQPDAWAMLQGQFGQCGARAGIVHRAAILRELRPLQQKICEAPRVCVLARSAFIPGDGDAITLVRAREIILNRSGEIVGSVESRDLSAVA